MLDVRNKKKRQSVEFWAGVIMQGHQYQEGAQRRSQIRISSRIRVSGAKIIKGVRKAAAIERRPQPSLIDKGDRGKLKKKIVILGVTSAN